jgi:DNA-directed RNA polymerase
MSVVRDAAKESFVEIYKDDWLTKIKDTLKAQLPIETQVDLPSEPQLGNFDPTNTLHSNYFIT